ILVLLIGALMVAGCADTTPPATPTPTPTPSPTATTPSPTATPEIQQELYIATTTSLYDTGLLDHLQSIFEDEHDVALKIVSAGTGIALEYGQRGDVDVMMVHDRAREDTFLADGYGTNRKVFAYNYFVIVGPEDDPASIAGMEPEEAFTTLMEEGATNPDVKFVSRGDNSGTHGKEKAIWASAGYDYATDIQGSGDWYVEAGAGMGATLVLANEQVAYTLSDIGTYLAYQGDLDLVVLVDQGDILLNLYSAMMINSDQFPDVNSTLAKEWINFLISDEIQDEIGSFGVAEYGRPLFYPAKGQWEELGVPMEETETPIP
ncbi:MAG: substrate-binding domain-containing protein, partial [Methanomicrobiaceae archaeon]|nr:substrate-binding domain-containing protein [Methanomicrobiaceae archaeon]